MIKQIFNIIGINIKISIMAHQKQNVKINILRIENVNKKEYINYIKIMLLLYKKHKIIIERFDLHANYQL